MNREEHESKVEIAWSTVDFLESRLESAQYDAQDLRHEVADLRLALAKCAGGLLAVKAELDANVPEHMGGNAVALAQLAEEGRPYAGLEPQMLARWIGGVVLLCASAAACSEIVGQMTAELTAIAAAAVAGEMKGGE
jgi:hypothetical protein